MKGKLRKVLTILLVLTLTFSTTVPASAGNRFGSSNSGWSVSSWLSDWWSSWWPFGHSDNTSHNDSKSDDKQNTSTETKDTSTSADAQKDTSSDTTQKTDTKSEDDTQLQLVEDQSTVAPGTKLRASTYKVMAKAAPANAAGTGDGSIATDKIDGYTVKYFPVTMFDYNTDNINAKTYNIDNNTGTGIYFNNGSPSSKKTGNGANYNYWTGSEQVSGKDYDRRYKEYVYGGLVYNSLTTDGKINFKEKDPGIFTTDETQYNGKTYKNVYLNVGFPFVYTNSNGNKTYTFDATQHGAFFNDVPASDEKLKFSKDPQKNENDTTASGKVNDKKGFYPFNNTTDIKTNETPDFHFGMSASIPFNMTRNGRLVESDNTSAPIKFDFSGDDDVWVFIDGKLVLDLGGIHDSVNGSIDFSKNTYSISSTFGEKGCGDVTKNYTAKTSTGKSEIEVGNLFNVQNSDGSTALGLFNQTRASFAANENHTLNIFYLERGEGTSNCKISFNLPQRDYVSVTKSIDPYLYKETKEGLEKTPSKVSDSLLKTLSNRSYDFVLYKNDNLVAANQTYSIYNASNVYTGNGSTNAEGEFSIRYGETARFTVSDISTYKDGENLNKAAYYVVEKNPGKKAYGSAVWSEDVSAAGGSSSVDVTTERSDEYASKKVAATGSEEANDYIKFTCTNRLLTPVADIVDDKVVIDYGLPDEINVLANDSFTGTGSDAGTLKVTGISATNSLNADDYTKSVNGMYGIATLSEDGYVIYTPTKQMTGVDVFYYNTGLDSDTSSTVSMGSAAIYIIPATSMYYEEDFGGENDKLVSYTGKWTSMGKASNVYQEEGRVGTKDDSPYGSDVAYKDDSEDSNGKSMHANLCNSAEGFSYSFTGTGTSFFARTTNTSGYMRVVLKDSNNNVVGTWLRNTKYDTSNPEATSVGVFTTLYNIPVFTQEGLDYGTYTVEVSLAKASEKFGKDFWLDGIRVINPLSTRDSNYKIAQDAYATDGEANMTSVTLRDKLLADNTVIDADENVIKWNDQSKFVVFTDIDGKIDTATRYQSIGPKEEVYLYKPADQNPGQSVTFSLKDWDPNENKLFLGIKAPAGEAKVKINNNELTLKNAADCYYEVSSYADVSVDKATTTFRIEATEGLVSLTNIKVTGNAEFTIVNNKDVVTNSEKKDVDADETDETDEEQSEDAQN